MLPGARARNHFCACQCFVGRGLNTTHSGSRLGGAQCASTRKSFSFFFVLHLSMVLKLGLLLLLALPASVDAGGAPSLSRRLCLGVFSRTRSSSGVKCSKSREYAVPAAVRCTARLDSSDPCFRVLLNRFLANLRAEYPEWCSLQRALRGEATLAQWLQEHNLKADPAATRCRHFDELYGQEYPRLPQRRGRLGDDIG